MPRTALAAPWQETPLSISNVATRLGINPSTLRTWDRRYGLGPSQHSVGNHRRYTESDVMRLERVITLVESGVSVADAASMVTDNGAEGMMTPVVGPVSVTELVASAVDGEEESAHRLIAHALTEEGLVRTWCHLVEPALRELRERNDGDRPGADPNSVLQAIVLDIVGKVSALPCRVSPCTVPVLLCVEATNRLPAHVVGAAITWAGVNARILTLYSHNLKERCQRHLEESPARIVALVGKTVWDIETLDYLANTPDLDVLLVGPDAPAHQAPQVSRVRTLTAAVDEIIDLARARSADCDC